MIGCKCKLAFLFCLLLLDFLVKGQDTLPDTAAIRDLIKSSVSLGVLPVYEIHEVDTPASYPGGDRGLLRFAMENIKRPILSECEMPPTKAAIRFIVEVDGTLSEIKLLKPNSISEQLEAAAKKMPRWKPAEKNGQPVRMRYTLNINCIKWE